MADTTKKRTPGDVAAIAVAYLAKSRGDAVRALHDAISDALDDLSDERDKAKDRLISHGYARSGPYLTRQ
ncbi:hypothetical protein MOX02_57500 [Methylobacterium oxalidis]|uniref:Uncharacterized protein n=1 Tax=Methylobacterium oxalidis TaxID=944322 RepID=A0A512JCM8_9HYPH|nr:hypothetical protein MOX02_57500 [Methylobacterium oxalidis]GJE35810.1 hypothetical protein LDDCCGHA_6031 [Methylobacterium oxalidis]GLS62258.1 hypothetical protein GCM10007888_06390 [Methylobacterium oxalidis]